MKLKIIFVSLIFSNILFVNAQLLNVKLDNQPETLSSIHTHESNEGGSATSGAAPVFPSVPQKNNTIVEEFHESSSDNSLVISSDVPSFSELEKVAANNKSNFIHLASNTIFPHLINDFERFRLIVTANQPGKVDVIYKSKKNNSTFTITLAPGGEAVEGRLRNEYLSGIKQLSKELGKDYLPKPTFMKFIGSRYINNGVKGKYINKEKSFSQFSVFECSSWMLGMKINFEGMEEADLDRFNEELIHYFNPARLTQQKPMNLKSNVDFIGNALKDTVVTGALFGSAVKKINWADTHVNEKERYSGFPDIYLEMHVESLKEYLKILGRKPNRSNVPENARFYVGLKSINDAGFLEEFIVETYDDVMIVPDTVDLDMSGFKAWKSGRELDVDLLKKRYKINYRALPY